MRTEKEILEILIELMEDYLCDGIIPERDQYYVEELIGDYNSYWREGD